MSRREIAVAGPLRAEAHHITALNAVFANAFTDRYRRDGLVGVRVPKLNSSIWRYALQDAGEGAMLWLDEQQDVLAFNIAHHSGVEGWMGPLAVRPDQQARGIGQTIVTAAIEWLQSRAVRTIGLETMPRTVDNIGFYSQLGFMPGPLTVTLVGEQILGNSGLPFIRLSRLSPRDRDDILSACRSRLARSAPGVDFTREHELTHELEIGDTIVIESNGVRGFALCHSAALVESRAAEELRLLKLYADSTEVFAALVIALETCAASFGLRRVAVRCQTEFQEAYASLVARGYRVRWTDLRMTLDGYPSRTVPEGEVLLSNWEI